MTSEIPTHDPDQDELIVGPAEADFSAQGRRQQKVDRDARYERLAQASSDFRKVLTLFGTSQARMRFVELCKQYVEHYAPNTSSGDEEFRSSQAKLDRIRGTQRGQAEYHNAIMEVLRKLIVAQPTKSKNWELLVQFQDRTLVEDVLVHGDWRDGQGGDEGE